MTILPFEQHKEDIRKQIALLTDGVDQAASQALYQQLREIYHAEPSKQIGKGKAIRHFFEQVQLFVNPADPFADLFDISRTPFHLRGEMYDRYKTYDPQTEEMKRAGALFADCDFGHSQPDFKTLFRRGIPGMLRQAQAYLATPGLTNDQHAFYQSVRDAYEGLQIFVQRLAEKAAACDHPHAQFAARNLKGLAEHAPQTLGEAMHLYFIFYAAQQFVDGQNVRSLGAIDQQLYPYYRHDIDAGILTEAEVRELIRYFLWKWNAMRVNSNLPFNLCSEVNDLTYLIIEEYANIDLPDPKIHIKCGEQTTDRVYRMVMESIKKGNNSFLFANDKVFRQALMHIGQTAADVEDYTLVGCYEPCSVGKEIPCSVNGGINMPLALETVLGGGQTFGGDAVGLDSGHLNDYTDFDAFYAAVKAQLKQWIDAAVADVNSVEAHYPAITQSPFISSTFSSCMERGRDAYAGGATYNNSSICLFGLATIVDSLMAIKQLVFEDGRVTLAELTEILKNNWAGQEPLRKVARDRCPKYGVNDPAADALACNLIEFLAGELNNRPNGRGGVYRLGTFSIDWIVPYGAKTGASADGRLAGKPLSKNMSPSVGMDKKGITGVIHSATKIDYTLIPDGTVQDLAFHPSAVKGDEGTTVMVQLLKLFFEQGGMAAHFNVVSPDTLRAAQKDPESYRNLQVRLCGWNVYFNHLSREMQDNMIASMENI